MRKTRKTAAPRPNYRAQLEASIEREQQWKARLDEAEQLVERLQGYVGDSQSMVNGFREANTVLHAQVDALRTHANALMQRYAGVKLDTQQFSFPQAQQWLKAEGEAIAATLNRVAAEAQRNQSAPVERAPLTGTSFDRYANLAAKEG